VDRSSGSAAAAVHAAQVNSNADLQEDAQDAGPSPLINPLWAINAGLAVFAIAVALIMMMD
jgi:hypothetical protein